MFLPFFPHNPIFTVLSRLRYKSSEHNSSFTLWRPEPDSFGLSESRMAARVDLHISGKKIFFFTGSFTLFSMTLLDWTRCSSLSFPVFQKNKQRWEYLFPLLFKISILTLFVNYISTYVYLYKLTLISSHLMLSSIKTIVKIKSQILRALLNFCYTTVLH